ncbi:major histocompatibility complex class I-related gene protein-like isoform X2 [Ahaetulla prasina]|uniref:major histocompatibility complex class I-related gene protein-like isoform X2 n=1 Tax=Ahaetulla prasina TaxID=499056 RepID=UPI00264924BB|nr:major histocompatibility complex class I-related gene protein-like isoform X2 [Ahaetulla prasina]
MGVPVAQLGLLSTAVVLLLRGGCAGSHSLRIFYTLVMGSSQDLPYYIVVAYVDDQLAARFDPRARRMLPQVSWLHKMEEEEEEDSPHFWDLTSRRVSTTERRFKTDLAILHSYHNSSRGFHSWQRVIGCDLSKDGHKTGVYQYGYDGEDFISLNQKTLTWTAVDIRAQVTKRRWEAEPFIAQSRNNFLEQECIQLLQKCMVYGKESLLRKEPPLVKVTRRIQYNSMETLICRVYGFYPKEMDATWRKDGEVWEQDTFRGGVLPNSDGTYHAWLSIEVDPKERDRYRCYVDHAGLPEPLIVAWKEPVFVPNMGLVAAVVGVVVVTVFIAVGATVYVKKCGRNAYRTASASIQDFGSPPVVSRGCRSVQVHISFIGGQKRNIPQFCDKKDLFN